MAGYMSEEELRRAGLLGDLPTQDLETGEIIDVPVEQKARILQDGVPEQPSTVSEVENAQINNQAKSPYQKTQSELENDQKPEEFDALSALRNNIRKYQEKADVPTKELDWKERLPDILASAHNILNYGQGSQQKMMNTDYGSKQEAGRKAAKNDDLKRVKELQGMYQKYIAMQDKDKMSPYQKAQVDLGKKKLAASEKMAAQKLVGGIKEESKAELARQKDERKQTETIQEENRKVRLAAQDSLKDIDKQIANVEKAATKLKNLSKTGIADTGPIDQYLSPMGNKGQELRQIFNEIALDKMTKMFAGMSKAIDSDAERKFFEQSQVSMGNFPAVNMGILNNMIANLKSLKAKNQGTLKSIDSKGREIAPEQQVSDFVTMIAPNGQTKNVRREQVQKYLDKGATIKE